MEVELRHLRAFVAVAASRSFTRAAERLFITQPALTRTVRQLESLLGAALIDRDTHPISLTPAGEEFLRYASRILGDLEIGVGVIRKHANIRLGFSWLLPDPWARHTVTRFEGATGNSISLVRCDDPLAAVDEGKVDVALVRGTGQGTRSVRIVHLFDETRVAVCSVHSSLAAVTSLTGTTHRTGPLSSTPSVAPPGHGRGQPAAGRDASSPRLTSTNGLSQSPLTAASASSLTSLSGAVSIPRCGSSRCVTPRSARYPSRSAPVSVSPCSGALSRPPALPWALAATMPATKQAPLSLGIRGNRRELHNQCAGYRVLEVIIRT